MYLYDQGRRLEYKETKNKNSELINHYKYGYNKVHMKNYEQRMHDSGKGNVMAYDELYRLTNMKFNVPDPTVENPTNFEKEKAINFDKLHNILSMVENFNGQTKTITTDIPANSDYAKLNQYASFDQWGLGYDKKGNTNQRGTQQLAYDYRNQLVTADDAPSNTQVEMKYDVLGRRTQKSVTIGSQTKIENYYHSGQQVIEVRDENDQVLRHYIYGNGIDEIIRMDKYEGDTFTSYYYHTDANGSVTAITDANGQLVERVTYDIYGMPTFKDAAGNKISKSSIGNNILFHGREYDPELNLYYFRARYYDPIMGRFLQTDPMGYADSMNLYQGFNMNPVNFTDPFGLETRQELYDKIMEYYKEEARHLHPGEDDYQNRKHYFEYLVEKYGTTKMNAKQLQEHYYNLIGEKVEIEKEESFILMKKIWASIKKGYNFLPGKAKKGGKRLWTKHLDERKEVEEEYKPVYGFLDEQYKAGCEYVGETTGDIAEAITEEVQLTGAVGVTAKVVQKGRRLRKVKKIKGGPKFPNFRDHSRRHSNLHPNAYYNQAVRHMKTGKPFKVRHEGKTKIVYITRLGENRFLFTSTNQSGTVIYTHMWKDVDLKYLKKKGIKLPEGF